MSFTAVAQRTGGAFTAVNGGNAVIGVSNGFEGYMAKPVDIDSDGIADLIYTYVGKFGAYVYAWRGNGDGIGDGPCALPARCFPRRSR